MLEIEEYLLSGFPKLKLGFVGFYANQFCSSNIETVSLLYMSILTLTLIT